jgi:hypothetical protein
MRAARMTETASTALMPKGSFGPGTDEVKTLLDKHEDANGVGLETSASE